MQFHNLKRKTKRIKSRQIGRGGTRGKTSGRGGKGQTARAGAKVRPEIRDMIKRIPKLRGRGKNSNLSIQKKPKVINVSVLEKMLTGSEVTPATLLSAGLISKHSGKLPKVKILGDGDLTKKFNVTGCLVSASAKAKIEKAGGKII